MTSALYSNTVQGSTSSFFVHPGCRMSQTQMISTTQVYARPRHQFMPNWMPRSQHGHKQYSQSQGGQVNVTAIPVEFDGKRLRKPVARKTVDYNSSMHEWLQVRRSSQAVSQTKLEWFLRISIFHRSDYGKGTIEISLLFSRTRPIRCAWELPPV